MKVLALRDGTTGKGPAVRRVRAGEVFEIPDGSKLAKWMEKVEGAAAKVKPKAEPKGPQTFSEMTKLSATPKGAEGLV